MLGIIVADALHNLCPGDQVKRPGMIHSPVFPTANLRHFRVITIITHKVANKVLYVTNHFPILGIGGVAKRSKNLEQCNMGGRGFEVEGVCKNVPISFLKNLKTQGEGLNF